MSSTLVPPVDTEPTDPSVAADRLITVLNDGSIAVLISIGHDLGLFEALAALPAASSEQIADAAGLNERYVREWLGGLVTGGFVDYDPAGRTYALGEAYSPFLTGRSTDNLARPMRFVTLMGQVAPLIVEKFRTGGGLDYADYPNFHAVQAEDSAAVNDTHLIDTILPLTGLTDRLRTGIDVADIGCGQGHAINLMARAFPESRFTGIDFSLEAVDIGRTEAADWGLTNVSFDVGDVAALDRPPSFDLITAFDAIHDQAHPATVLSRICAALRPAGTFLMADINASSRLEDNCALPWGALLYAISTLHCMSVSLGQGGDGLGTVWGVQLAEQMLGQAGFTEVQRHEIEQDPFNAYFVARS